LQQSLCLWAVALGDCHGRFSGRIILRSQKLHNPVKRCVAFDRENTGVAGPEQLPGVGRELRQQAKKKSRRVGTNLLYRANNIDSD
jgi:hypothetical protein